jgi:hypothetical protein
VSELKNKFTYFFVPNECGAVAGEAGVAPSEMSERRCRSQHTIVSYDTGHRCYDSFSLI